MWKDFFYYSKSERRAVYVLLSLIVLLLIAVFIRSGKDYPSSSQVAEKVERTDSSLTQSISRKRNYNTPETHKSETHVLFEFNPNSADSIELSRLGLPPFVVKNILKYRQKGGRFTTPASFARIYGLSQEQFSELEPYIRIPKSTPKFQRSASIRPVDSVEMKRSKPIQLKYPEGTLVDVNVADTAELKRIPGIGSVIARNIVAYRERLGGYYELNQLLEVRFVTPELLKWFKLGEAPIKKIALNTAGLDKLRSHPYLTFYQAKVIMEYRKKKGKIKSLSQLSLYEEFTEKDLIRLVAYVSFD